MTERLKLRAVDGDDLAVMSAVLQDAILPVAEMCYHPDERRFVAVFNRFKWESRAEVEADGYGPGPSADVDDMPFERTHCALTIEGVEAVKRRNISLKERHRLLSLLTILHQDEGLMLVFSGDAGLFVRAPGWQLRLEDVGEPWPTRCRPDHVLERDEAELRQLSVG